MTAHDPEIRPVVGLPGPLPAGETALWSGRPDAWALARDALAARWVGAYFVALAAWRFGALSDTRPLGEALAAGAWMLAAGAAAVGLLCLFAFAQARATTYTITTRRVVMRVGAALPVTFNLPFRQIETAALSERRDGTGSIAFSLDGGARLSYLVLWPHVRPWRFSPTAPALRCVPDAAKVARILGEAASREVAAPVVARRPRAAAAAAIAAE